MSENSRSFFAVQLALDATPAQVARAVAMIHAAFKMQADADVPQPTDEQVTQTFAVTPQVTPEQVASAELDKDGLPWDERIHAGTKTKTQKGVWTRKKGVDDAVFDAVIAELRQQYPAAAAVTPPVVPTAPTVPTVPSINLPAAPAALTPYQELTDWLAKNTGADKAPLTDEWVKQTFADNGTSLAALATDQDKAKQFLDAFRGLAA